MENRIECGRCKSKYSPRVTSSAGIANWDYSCPVCKHGSVKEGCVDVREPKKTILLDCVNLKVGR